MDHRDRECSFWIFFSYKVVWDREGVFEEVNSKWRRVVDGEWW